MERRLKNRKEMVMKRFSLSCVVSVLLMLGLTACQSKAIKSDSENQALRWYNQSVFAGVNLKDSSYYDLGFDLSFSNVEGDPIPVKSCLETLSIRDSDISEREFARWDLLKTNCESVKRFYNSPESAFSYWPAKIDFSLLKSFPATSIPYLGGQGLDGHIGSLSQDEPSLNLIESSEHSVKVSYDGIVVNYVEVARADFNRDGYQDLFVRMDWSIENSVGVGNDWIVLTKKSADGMPVILWRR